MKELQEILINAEIFATKITVEDFPAQLIYHNIKYIRRVVKASDELAKKEQLSDEDTIYLKIVSWFLFLGFKDLESLPRTDFISFFAACNDCSQMIALAFFKDNNYSDEHAKVVIDIIKEAKISAEKTNSRSKVLHDAITSDYSKNKGMNRIKTIYQQMLLLQIFNQGKSDFYNDIISFLNSHKYLTKYGIEVMESKKNNLIRKLEKEKKELGKNEDLLVQRELNISQIELKTLKKNLRSVQGRDDRGIQTMFRTTMRNHYTLNQMIDRKSNIMISVNTLIISVLVSQLIGVTEIMCVKNVPYLIVLIFSVISVIRAIMAIIPEEYHGRFTEDDVRKKSGNLLFFANFHKMKFADYEWGMVEMMNDASFMYNSMIKDLYFLGKELAKKYKHIRRSLQSFAIGIVLGVITFLIFENLNHL